MTRASRPISRPVRRTVTLLWWAALAWFVLVLLASVAFVLAGSGPLPMDDGSLLGPSRWDWRA
jgi:hypothetical protein